MASMTPWELLDAQIVTCTRCPRLVDWREKVARERRKAFRDEEYWGKPVPGFGDHEGRLLIVGLAPGAHGANRTGRLFTGDSSGDFLYSALYRAGFASQPVSRRRDDGMALQDAFLTAACRCVPPGNKPSPGELAACRPFLERELVLLEQIRVVVALGRIAFDAVTRLRAHGGFGSVETGPGSPPAPPTAMFGHGASCRLRRGGPWLIASFHPSRQNTQTGRLTPAMFDAIWRQARILLD